ncbi:hypothetical protein VTO42DRAFT_4829 [Malbranchea cinnamomea]
MSAVVDGAQSFKKRKKDGEERPATKRRAVSKDADNEKARIQELEDQIAESRKYYNNIVTLLSMLHAETESPCMIVAVSLCRVFCRLLAGGHLNKLDGASEQDQILFAWLRERYQDYQQALLLILRNGGAAQQTAALALSMQLIKEHSTHLIGSEVQVWNNGFFSDVVAAMVEARDGERVRTEFIKKYVKEYHDIAVYTMNRLANYASEKIPSERLESMIFLLSNLGSPPPADHKFENFYSDISKVGQKNRAPFLSVNSYKLRVQAAWLAVLRNDLTLPQRKALLRVMSHVIAPWFIKPEMLMDFLTDSYNQGGSVSLLALSGLFYLIQEKNLDYPQFYPKLYSLLDSDLLHSKHRSRFFRLLDTFLASTHLPATLVASFIKRLSRLALNAPPAAIVVIVPMIYNLLKSHPTCTFMIHRAIRDKETEASLAASGMDDPFDPHEPDPTLTDAISSSLWEIETLQSHYHPNVASLAKIISEQFTKPAYNLEDFLDHSYQAMLETELGKEEKPFKKTPVVEFQIPKRIFTDRMLAEDGGVDNEVGKDLRRLWEF